MTDEEFRKHLDQLGGDFESWPATLRDAGLSLLERSARARDLLAEMAAIEDGLRAPEPPAPPGLADRIIAAALADGDEDGDHDGDEDAAQRSTG